VEVDKPSLKQVFNEDYVDGSKFGFNNSLPPSFRTVSHILEVKRQRACAGVIISFSSSQYFDGFTTRLLEANGINIFYLIGDVKCCLNSFIAREKISGRGLPDSHWIKHNEKLIKIYEKNVCVKDRSLNPFEDNCKRRSLNAIAREIKNISL